MAGPTPTSPDLWVRASDLSGTKSNGDPVAYTDLVNASGSSYVFTGGTSGATFQTNVSPTGGPSIRGDGAAYFAHDCNVQPRFIVAAGKVTSTGHRAWASCQPSSGGTAAYFHKPGASVSGENPCEVIMGGTTVRAGYAVGVPWVHGASLSGGVLKTFHNNGVAYTGTGSDQSLGSTGYLFAGYFGGNPVDFFAGDLYEFLLYGTKPSDSEITDILAYLCAAHLPAAPASAPYVFATFGGAVTAEELVLATGSDGASFQEVTSSYVPPPRYNGGTTPLFSSVRDPSLISASVNILGLWWTAHTQHPTPGVSTTFAIASSPDLAVWSPAQVVDCSAVSGLDTVWAPEFFVDSNGDVYVFFAGRVSSNFAIYYVKANDPTNLLTTTWTTPTAVTGTGFPTTWIDGYCVQDGSTYYLFFKNQGASAYIGYATSTSPTSGYTTIVNGSANTLGIGDGEGPSFATVSGQLRLYFDQLTPGGTNVIGESYSVTTGGPGGTYGSPVLCTGTAIGGGVLTLRHGTVVIYVASPGWGPLLAGQRNQLVRAG